jgi:hypothetical protein
MNSKKQNTKAQLQTEDELTDQILDKIWESQLKQCSELIAYWIATKTDDTTAVRSTGKRLSITTRKLQSLYAIAETQKVDIPEWRHKSEAQTLLRRIDSEQRACNGNLIVMAKTAGGK